MTLVWLKENRQRVGNLKEIRNNMKGQLSAEYLMLGLVVLGLITISLTALGRIKNDSMTSLEIIKLKELL